MELAQNTVPLRSESCAQDSSDNDGAAHDAKLKLVPPRKVVFTSLNAGSLTVSHHSFADGLAALS